MNSISRADLFVFSKYEADLSTGDLYFHYDVIVGNDTTSFKEYWHLNNIKDQNDLPKELLESVLQSLHLIVGTSYYKAFCPERIEISNYTLTSEQAKVWETIYTKGLGEFFYKNQIDYRELVKFPFDESKEEFSQETILLEDKALVMHGGGKDSIVSAEIVKNSNVPFDLFCLSPKDIQKNVAKVMGKEIVTITRHIDPKLIELNKVPTTYNGHVPISTFYTFAAVLQALLGSYKYIVISSERSSSYGNVEYLGEEINHQWSKSEEAEDLLRSYIETYINKDLQYFSMLRPWYEIKVTEKFARFPTYFEVFSSSNHNFKLSQDSTAQRWDYASPKTLFVFTMLSAFLPKDEIVRIFGENLYEKSEFIDIFRELLGLSDVKPFECVGTPDEMIVAMKMAHDKGIYDDDAVMKMFESEILSKDIQFETLRDKVFSYGNTKNIPNNFRDLL